jgi:uncharacterized protein (DUF2461 family)
MRYSAVKILNRHKLTLLRKAAGRRAPRGFEAIPLDAEFQNFNSLSVAAQLPAG